MSDKINIIGGGVSGLTTALTLQTLGYDTEIYTSQTYDSASKHQPDPAFASCFPSASVIPHSVGSDQMEQLFIQSQTTFYELRRRLFPGLTLHKHFEIFEFEKESPNYLSWMLNGQTIDASNIMDLLPRCSTNTDIYGWVFNCIFADWPIYFPALHKAYRQAGGQITIKKVTQKNITQLPAQVIINCSGLGSRHLFEDPAPHWVLRGHLLHCPDRPLLTAPDSEIISYNYTPEAAVYSDSEGKPCDVYCYPRKDGWILGGSRQLGTISDKEKWEAEKDFSPMYEQNSISFPAPIYDLNKQIIKEQYGLELGPLDTLHSKVGYRYIRKKKNGLRLEKEAFNNKVIYHNYGHGGAGVTLSWGCAFHIAQLITSQEIPDLHSQVIDKLSSVIETNTN